MTSASIWDKDNLALTIGSIMAVTIAAVGFAAALFSVGYMRSDLAAGHVPDGESGLRWYYLGFHLFIWTMLATVMVNSLGLLWVGIEATTLLTAFLICIPVSPTSLEAMWRRCFPPRRGS